jgi:cytidylate kinase
MSLAPVIAIDGPSASGKGTVTSLVAKALGFHALESGALYRLVALASLHSNIAENDEAGLEKLATGLGASFSEGRILLNAEDVTDALRGEAVGNLASTVARLPGVRSALLVRQRAFRQTPGLVADGRDMGTVVFPDALLKVFLTAAVRVRAARRYKQLNDKGIRANLASLSRDLAERDERDAKRAAAPLVPAPDAVLLDSSDLSVEDVVAQVVQQARERLESPRSR